MALDVIRASSDIAWSSIGSNAVMKHWCLELRSWLLVWETRAHVKANLEEATVEVLRHVSEGEEVATARTYGHWTAEIGNQPRERVGVQKLKVERK